MVWTWLLRRVKALEFLQKQITVAKSLKKTFSNFRTLNNFIARSAPKVDMIKPVTTRYFTFGYMAS